MVENFVLITFLKHLANYSLCAALTDTLELQLQQRPDIAFSSLITSIIHSHMHLTGISSKVLKTNPPKDNSDTYFDI